MHITADISLYPLDEQFTDPIRDFIHRLRREPGLDIVTNQLSTQVRGDFDAVTGALNRCMREAMNRPGAAVFVVKYVNADLPIGTTPAV
jgi:uncharacterized protein YqgV (UPF0045/DUF77 family)